MRVFIALVPDTALRASLAARAGELAQRIGGRVVPAANLHLTLAFIGEVDATRQESLLSTVAALSPPAFALLLDRIGEWRHAAVAWIAPSQIPAELARLRAQIDEALDKASFPVEVRAFHPHVTLVRRQLRTLPDAPCPPLTWSNPRVALMRSERESGVLRYREVVRAALNG